MTIKERVLVRRPQASEAVIDELIKTTQDRILLRAGVFLKSGETIFPPELESIVVDVTVALYNRHELEHEGIDSEGIDSMSISFVDDLLAKYDRELSNYVANREKVKDTGEKVKFL